MNCIGKLTLAAFSFTFLLTVCEPIHAQEPVDTSAYVEGQSFQVSEKELQDLKAYVERAKETLIKALAEAQEQNPDELHGTLHRAIVSALAESSFKQELLLFRYALNRALALDEIFMVSAPVDQARALSVSSVLLPHISLALRYYEKDDLPRLGTDAITSPDWEKFAVDQIYVLTKVATRAPSTAAKVAIIKRALGWTIRSLNSSINRREHAKQILDLSSALATLDSSTLGKTQYLLITTAAELANPAATGQGKPIFPKENYPSIEPKHGFEKNASIFPLWKKNLGGPLYFLKDKKEEHSAVDFYALAAVEGGMGGGMEHEVGGKTSGGFNAIDGRVTTAVGMSPLPGGTIGGDLRTALGVNGQGVPVYNLKATAHLSSMLLWGVWVALEANQFSDMAEHLAEVGWNFTLPIAINGKVFVMARIALGEQVSEYQKGTEGPWVGIGGHQFINGQLLVKLAKFIIRVEPSATYISDDNENTGFWGKSASKPSRLELTSSLTVPLGLLFGNDAIRFEGQIVHYDLPTFKYTVQKLGAIYELQW